jgi:hypothetical protein
MQVCLPEHAPRHFWKNPSDHNEGFIRAARPLMGFAGVVDFQRRNARHSLCWYETG